MSDDTFELDANDFVSNESETPEVETQEETTPEDSSTTEKKETVEADGFDEESQEESTEEGGDTAEEDQPEEEADKEDQKPRAKNSAENRKEQLRAEIQELTRTRDERRREIESANAQAYKPATAEELVENGMSETDARVEALNQKLAMQEYNQRVAETNMNLDTQSLQVFNDFPQFDPDSPDYDKSLADAAAQTYQDIAGFEKDENTGQIVSVKVMPYKFYKFVADTAKSNQTKGEVTARKNVEKQLASAESPITTVKRDTPKKDGFLEGFDSIK